jgi:nicotinamidase-related amidase
MATVRAGNKSALVVVDVQVGVVKDAWQAPRVIGNIAQAVQRARAAKVPVLWVQHVNEEMPSGSAAWQWVPELVPHANETRIHKHFNSSFEETTLEQELAQRGVSHMVLAGAMTNWCIRATAYGALERGYDLTLLKDAHTTANMALEDGGQVEAEQVVQDLNIAMTWLNYPGRACSTATAAAVAFVAA